MIPPKAEEFMAKRMGATVRIFGKCKKYTFRTESLSNVVFYLSQNCWCVNHC